MAEGFEVAHQLPPNLSDLLQATMVTKKLSDRIHTLRAVNRYDHRHKTRFGLTVLNEFIYDSDQRLIAPGNESEIIRTTTADSITARIIGEVTCALGPEYGTRTRIGEMLVERSAILYVADNYSGQEAGVGFMAACDDRPTHEEPYLIIHQGNMARLNNLDVALFATYRQS